MKMLMQTKMFGLSVVILSTLIVAIHPLHAAVFTWGGGGGGDNWSTAGNWSPDGTPTAGNDLRFGTSGASRLNNTNDFTSGTGFSRITFEFPSAFTLNGNAILLGVDGIDRFGSASSANTVNLAGITLSASQDWFNGAAGLETIASPINLNGFD